MGRRDERGVEKEVLGGSEVACSVAVKESTDPGNIFEFETTGGGKGLDMWLEREGRVEDHPEAPGVWDWDSEQPLTLMDSCRKRAEKKAEMADRQCGILMHCPITSHGHREEFGKIIKECKEESFCSASVPYQHASHTSPHPPSWPGSWGLPLERFRYFGKCQKKFEKLGVQNPFEAGFTPGILVRLVLDFSIASTCHKTCEECKEEM
ncbi:unnamed protein product [Ranitomeya imitator]|uniref:Uncharacterized protein n=1 Tax=Ranitomeya imitator TaxID=111125 RepID=A0ABN9ME11_9NEOB|nr:unnamed protein product [Ranitomeya imitator]